METPTKIIIFIIIYIFINLLCYNKFNETFTLQHRNCIELCKNHYSDELSKNIDCNSPGNLTWSSLSIKYLTNNSNEERTEVTRKTNIYINNSSNKVLLYLGGTYEINPKTNNIFCKYNNKDSNKYETAGGGYYYRNECMIEMSKYYTIIQVPQITEEEVKTLVKNTDRTCDNKNNHSDGSQFWFVYNNYSTNMNPDKNNLGERYNNDICGKSNKNSPDKDFFNNFFKNNYINEILEEKELYIGGYSGGGYMTGRLIFESIRGNIPYKFKAAFILSGAPFHCISPWTLTNQYCPPSMIDDNEYKKTIHEDISDEFKKDYVTINEVDFYRDITELTQFPPTLFLSPENDDVVRKELVRYYYKLLKNLSDKHKIIIPFKNDNNLVKHNWFGESNYIDDLEFKDINTNYLKSSATKVTNGMCDEIIKFFNNI